MPFTERVRLWLNRFPLVMQFLRFGAIGFLNTAIDFAVLNLLISLTHITSGLELAVLDAFSFGLAVLHSYFWNKYWAFGKEHKQGIVHEFMQLLVVAFLGAVVVVFALLGAKNSAPYYLFALITVGMLVAEFVVWNAFQFNERVSASHDVTKNSQEVILFFVISIIGTIINSALVGLFTTFITAPLGINDALWANAAKIVATVLSLVWNFIGYKAFVFKSPGHVGK